MTGGMGPSCGHGTASAAVSEERCWDCHLAYLRDTDQPARADRLVELKSEHDEGGFDLEALEEGMVDLLMSEFCRRFDDEATVPPRSASRRRIGRPAS